MFNKLTRARNRWGTTMNYIMNLEIYFRSNIVLLYCINEIVPRIESIFAFVRFGAKSSCFR